MAKRYVEDRHEAKTAKRVVDVRPTSTQYAEWLSVKFNLLMVCGPLLVFAFILPTLSVFLLPIVMVHIIIHKVTRPILPFRYPAGNKDKDTKGKKGTGILLLGYVDSDSEYERFKEIWKSDDDLRKHMLIIGSTGSGKSETLKGIFFNALCWSSGFFVADGKADNKLPTDTLTMVRSFGRDDDLLFLNFLLGGKTPEQVRKSRRRRTNKINPVSSADADTIIQMGANMLPKVEGEGKSWQEKALNLWRAVIQALCYMRDVGVDPSWITDEMKGQIPLGSMDLSISTVIDYLALPKVELLYVLGYKESLSLNGEWSYGFNGVKAYLESGCPGFKVDRLLAKHCPDTAPAPSAAPARGGAKASPTDQDPVAFEQHAYRSSQMMPVLNLLDKTYGYIFRDKYAEIDMIDATLNNRILVMLIPSLEKSAQEAENLGKLAIACLRVMMGKNLGSEIEGTRNDLLDSKATAAPYPYMIALDELAYYFADGIAVMFAQARSLGFCMIAAAQDLEKLTEGSKQAEAGAMLANQVSKFFMRIDDAGKTYEFISKVLGKISVALRRTFEEDDLGYKRSKEVNIEETERVSLREMQEKGPGEAVFNSSGKTVRASSLYIGDDLKDHSNKDFFVLRFLQVEPPSLQDLEDNSCTIEEFNGGIVEDDFTRGASMLNTLRGQRARDLRQPKDPVIEAVAAMAATLTPHMKASERAILLYEAAKEAYLLQRSLPAVTQPGSTESNHGDPGGEMDGSGAGDEHPDQPDQDDDILSFLGAPFERKPAQKLLNKIQSKAQEASASKDSVAVQPDPFAGLLDARTATPIQRLIARGRSLNVLGADAVDQGASNPYSPSQVYGLSPDHDPSAADWIGGAVEDASQSLVRKSENGISVVGFSDVTSNNVILIEELLKSPDAQLSAARIESIVSTKITPEIDVDAQASYKAEDIEGFFESLARSSK